LPDFADGNKCGIQKELAESTESFVSRGVIHFSLAFATEDFDSSYCMCVLLILNGVKRVAINIHAVEKDS
jgi:hypothetical protein